MIPLAGGAVLLLSLLVLHALLAPLLHGAARWMYRGGAPTHADSRRARTAFLLLGLSPLLVALLGVNGLLHLAEGDGAWASVLASCQRLHDHCDVLLEGGAEPLVYALVIGAAGLWLARATWRGLWPLVQLRRRGMVALPESLHHKLCAARALGVHLPVRVVEGSSGLAVSAGLWRPLVLLSPDVVALLSVPELAAVLAHEAAHARNLDGLRALILRFAGALSPLGGRSVVDRAYALDRELLADADAVARGTDPLTLASALVAMARAQLRARPCGAPAALGEGSGSGSLQTRVTLLLRAADAPLSATRDHRALVAAATLLGVISLLPHAAFGALVLVHCAVESAVHLLT